MLSVFGQISVRVVGILIYLSLVYYGIGKFDVIALLGASSLANIFLNICCYILHLYNPTKYPLTDDTKNVLFDAVLVLSIVLFNDFRKNIASPATDKQEVTVKK